MTFDNNTGIILSKKVEVAKNGLVYKVDQKHTGHPVLGFEIIGKYLSTSSDKKYIQFEDMNSEQKDKIKLSIWSKVEKLKFNKAYENIENKYPKTHSIGLKINDKGILLEEIAGGTSNIIGKFICQNTNYNEKGNFEGNLKNRLIYYKPLNQDLLEKGKFVGRNDLIDSYQI